MNALVVVAVLVFAVVPAATVGNPDR